jgi:hypothetical protein
MRYLPAILPLVLLAAIPATAGPTRTRAPASSSHGESAIFDRVAEAQRAGSDFASKRLEPWTPPALAPVPEPAIWSMLIAGIGFAGAALRRTARQSRKPVRR